MSILGSGGSRVSWFFGFLVLLLGARLSAFDVCNGYWRTEQLVTRPQVRVVGLASAPDGRLFEG